MPSSVAVILGSAFETGFPEHFEPEPIRVPTPFGTASLLVCKGTDRPAYALFRHGLPHRLLPHQINYRANAAALRELDCGALLVNSSVGVLDERLPLFEPMLLTDLVMLDNRLPDGTACTLFTGPTTDQGHLVPRDGLFSTALNRQIEGLAPPGLPRHPETGDLVFYYAGGPRTKTPAENRLLAEQGVHVNSMTLAPEIILANELGIPCAGLVVGHKYSVPGVANPDGADLSDSLRRARGATERILLDFLRSGEAVPFGNHIHRFT
ncbi:MAG: 5'-methylthioadenosine phosphorylase [Opitutales bacterium]